MRSKAQLLKTSSILQDFTSKIKSAQIGETLTPETVKEISQEIMEVASVAAELANEIAEGVPAEDESRDALGERDEKPEQIEVAADETEDEKKKRMEKEKTAADDKDEDKEKIKNLEASIDKMQREVKLAKLAPKYASLFPQSMHEAKLNEILNSKQPLNIVEAKIQEASDIISNKTMVKVASMNDSIYDVGNSEGEEVNIAKYV